MEYRIIDAIQFLTGEQYTSIQDAKERGMYTEKELLSIWLKYEGIVGYDYTLIEVLKALGILNEKIVA